MRGIRQPLFWSLLTGLSLGAGVACFKGQPVVFLVAGSIFRILRQGYGGQNGPRTQRGSWPG